MNRRDRTLNDHNSSLPAISVNCSNPFLVRFSNEMFIRAGIHNMLVKIANIEDLEQIVLSGSALFVKAFWQVFKVQTFRTSTIQCYLKNIE